MAGLIFKNKDDTRLMVDLKAHRVIGATKYNRIELRVTGQIFMYDLHNIFCEELIDTDLNRLCFSTFDLQAGKGSKVPKFDFVNFGFDIDYLYEGSMQKNMESGFRITMLRGKIKTQRTPENWRILQADKYSILFYHSDCWDREYLMPQYLNQLNRILVRQTLRPDEEPMDAIQIIYSLFKPRLTVNAYQLEQNIMDDIKFDIGEELKRSLSLKGLEVLN
jgi:hypothetical protein